MPDQLPAAISDSANSFDSLFALNLDTKQRFDNILNNQQKPIDYPLPDYDKEMNPKGLSQDDLLNPLRMKGSIGEALFSPDPKIAAYATDQLRGMQTKLPVNQGIGVPDRFQYSKEMDKYLNGDYGYNPYESIQKNEDFNYRYDYLSQSVGERIFKNIGTGLGRFVGSVGLKLGQTLGYMGSVIGSGVAEIFNSKDNNFMSDVADNSLSRWMENVEQDMKNSNTLSVFKPQGWEDKGFFSKLGNGAFWTDEVADGAAFMGEMVASMYLLGGLGRFGALAKFGETEINLGKALGKLGSLGKYTGRGLDFALKTATGADDIAGIGRWAFSVTSESAMEASEGYHTSVDKLKADRQAGLNNYTDDEIQAISGDRAAGRFKANMLILSASQAFENRFIFGPLFKRLGIKEPHPQGDLMSVSESTVNLEELAKATRKSYNYKSWLGKQLNWKDSNSRLRFYGSRALSATAMEGFWEENAQLAVERLSGADNLTLTSFLGKLKEQTVGAITGNDPEAAENIGLGGAIGILGTGVVGKVRGGDKLFQGERRKIEADTHAAINVYEQFRKAFLNYQDIYIRDAKTGQPILDEFGNLQVDDTRAAGLLDGTNKFLSKQMAADKVDDPLLRKHLQDDAMSDYVVAAKMAGIYDKAVQRFDNLKNIDPKQLENLGFDPNTTVDSAYMKDSLKEFGKIYESVQESPSPKLKEGETQDDDRRRKDMLYKVSTGVYSATKIIAEYQSKMMDKDFPSVFSPEAEGNSSEVQLYNSLIHQQETIEQFRDMAKENSDFYDGFVKSELARIERDKERVQAQIDLMHEQDKEEGKTAPAPLIKDPRGFYYTPGKYEGYNDKEISMMLAIENDAQKKHAEYTVIRSQKQYLTNKFGNPQDGIANSKAYLKFIENMQKKDEEEDNKTNPPTTPPPAGPSAPPTAAGGPVQPTGTNPTVPAPPTPPPNAPAGPTNQKVTLREADVRDTLRNLIFNGVQTLKGGTLPNYTTIENFIVENQADHANLIANELLRYAKESGNAVIAQIANNGLIPATNLEYDVMSVFTDGILDSENIDEAVSTPIFNYKDDVDKAIEDYKKASAILTDVEAKAIDLIKAKPELLDSVIKPYVLIIVSPTASVKDKKDALRGISDQYLDPNAGDTVGAALGPELRDAIDALGYPVPTLAEAETPPVVNPIEELAAKAGVSVEGNQPLEKLNGNGVNEDEEQKISDFADKFLAGTSEFSPEEKAFFEANKMAINMAIYEKQQEAKNKKDEIAGYTEDIEARRQSSLADIEAVDSDEASGNTIYETTVNGTKVQDIDREDLEKKVNRMYDEEVKALTAPPILTDDQVVKSILTQLDPGMRMIAELSPSGFIEYVSQMAQNYAEKWQPSTNGDTAYRAEQMFGKITLPDSTSLIDYAKKQYPVPLTQSPSLAEEIKTSQPSDARLEDIEKRRQAELDYYFKPSLTKGKLKEFDRNYKPTKEQQATYTTIQEMVRGFINAKYDTEIGGPPIPPVETQAKEATNDTSGSGIEQPPIPPTPPSPPKPVENSDTESADEENFIDVMVNGAKKLGKFVFPQNMPAEVIMEGDKAKITDGAVQLKTTTSDQQLQLLRQHNILKEMGEKTNSVNFWSEDEDGKPLYQIRLEMGDENKHSPWVYNTGEGLINQKTGKLNRYPLIVAMVVDQNGGYVYFSNDGKVTDNKLKGKPFGFVYTIEDYLPFNLNISRRGVQLETGEALNGEHGFLSSDPLMDIRTAIQRGVQITGIINEVTSGKLSAYNVDNSGATWAKEPHRRTVQEIIDSGDIDDTSPVILNSGEYYEYSSSSTPGAPTQQIKVGQPYLLDERSGTKIPLRGKQIKDLTVNGKPFLTPDLKNAIESLQKDKSIELPANAITPESQALMENMFNMLRAILYSQNTPIFINTNKTEITMLDLRPTNIPLMDTEINYSTNISILSNPFELDSEGFSYDAFVKENFLSGAVPAELTKGQKSFEKLNRRIIFTLNKSHQEVLDSIGAKGSLTKAIRMQTTDFTKFVNKTYKKRSGTDTVTVTGYSDGQFTVSTKAGTITQSTDTFMRQLRTLEEVKLPEVTPEITQEFTDRKKLSKDEIAELREKSKTMTDEDLNNLTFDC